MNALSSLRTGRPTSLVLALSCTALVAACGDNFPTAEDAALSGADVVADGLVSDGVVTTDGQVDGADNDGAVGNDADATIGDDGDGTIGADGDATVGDDGDGTIGDDGDGTIGDDSDSGGGCPGAVGCACSEDADCASKACLPDATGATVCYAGCSEDKGCAAEHLCQEVEQGKKACVPEGIGKDLPCVSDDDCQIGTTSGVCTSYGAEGAFCRPSCTADGDCEGSEKCAGAKDASGADVEVCAPDGMPVPACTPFAVAIGAETLCYAAGLPGCTATRVCEKAQKDGDPPVLSACTPAAPVSEACDGNDEDCDGVVDNGSLCDDSNPCTDDLCDGVNGCKNDANNVACDDANPCTKDDTCVAALCAGVTATCDDGNPCTDDACDIAIGCTATDNSASCDDSDACTEGDACAVGLCAGATVDCDDNDVCTDDACDPLVGCTHAKNDAPCDDADKCTDNDTCAVGLCAGVTVDCDDNDPCTDDVCDSKVGCSYSKNTAPCDDGDACTDKDACDGLGLCSGVTVDCEDGNACTDDPCDPKSGCAPKKMTTKKCDDNNACTENDICDGKGNCTADKVDCEDGNTCTDDPCDPKSGCAAKVMTNKPCDDNNACTEKDTCDGKGACASTPVNCEDGNQCTDDPCDPKSGCAAKVFTNKPCDDKANCKVDGVCDGKGACGKLIDSCDDGSPCTTDACVNGAGCDYKPANEGGKCDDGDACSVEDVCTGGKCGGKAKDCDDNNVCTDDSCKGGTCAHLPNSVTCTDNDVCTGGDSCAGGACKPGKTWVCEDGLQCTDDPCDPVKGCLLKKLTTKPCDDNEPCTDKSACDGKGNCVGSDPKDCDDKNPCTIDACVNGSGCKSTAVPVKTACEDDNLCTVDTVCDGKGGCGGGTDTTGKACDDGDSCTSGDTCDAKTGCAGKPVVDCGKDPLTMPYKESFTCGSTSSALWSLGDTKAGELGWRIDGLPAPPGKPAPDCALNYNNDTNFQCASGASKVGPDLAGSPIFDASKALKPTLRFNLAGSWETGKSSSSPTGYYDWFRVMAVEFVGGKPVGAPEAIELILAPGLTYKTYTVDLMKYAGKTFAFGFEFGTSDCIENSGTGPFVDDIELFDGSCAAAGVSCDDGNTCTDDACDAKTGECVHVNNDKQSCDDDNPCTTNACKAGACTNTGNADGAQCDDGNLCSSDDVCASGKCLGKAVDCTDTDLCTTGEYCDAKTGKCAIGGKVDCNDGDVCTADACVAKTGLCAHTPIAGCKPTCKVDGDCEDPGVCQDVSCDAGTCVAKAANEGALCGVSATCASGQCVASKAGWAKAISANPSGVFFCALRHDGKVACWGRNDQGQIGNGAKGADVPTPTEVMGVANAVQISAGADHACALDAGGKVWCWGDNGYGQLGDGKTADSDKAVEATAITDATYVSAGSDFTCWITKTATVKCLGYGSLGRLGNGSTSSSNTPVDVKGLTGIVALHTQYYFSCAVRNDHTLHCWGYNFDKQLDPSQGSTVSTSVQRPGAVDVDTADAGYATSCWTSGGKGWCVGDNSDGQLGDGTSTDSADPVEIVGPTQIASIPGGSDHAVALTQDRVLWGAGKNFYGQLAVADKAGQLAWIKTGFPTGLLDADASDEAVCAITAKGTVVCAGNNSDGQLGNGQVGGSSDVAGPVLDFCTKADECDDGDPCTANLCGKGGQCFYEASSGASCDDGDACTNKDTCDKGTCKGAAVVCDDKNACTVGEQCAVVSGQPVCLSGTDKICDDGKPCTLDSCDPLSGDCVFTPAKGCLIGCKGDKDCDDGSVCTTDTCVVATGACVYKNAADGAICGVGATCSAGTCAASKAGWAKSIKANSNGRFFCAQTQSDQLACWGRNDQGQLGADSKDATSATPKLVVGLAGVKAYDTGADHACAIDKDDKLWCWGDDVNGELGDGNTTDSPKPVAVTVVKAAVDVCAGDGFTCTLDKDGGVHCWGDNFYGQLGNGTTDDSPKAAVTVAGVANVAAIDCDSNSACALTKDGTLYCWGDNGDKEIDAAKNFQVPDATMMDKAGTVDLFGSGYDTNCWRSGGKLQCKGDNGSGQLGNGTKTDSATPVVVSGPAGAIKVTGGFDHMAVLAGDGKVWQAGENSDGQQGDGTTEDATKFSVGPWKAKLIDIATSAYTSCGLTSDGQIWCVGGSFYGEAGAADTSDQLTPVLVAGLCSGNAACNDGDLCTADVCGKDGVCTNKAVDCDDNNACTIGEACNGKDGTCTKGKATDCDDGNECTVDSCDTKTGACAHAAIKGCIPSCKIDSDCPDQGYCASPTCTIGKCIYKPVNNGNVCDEGKTCNGGSCTASAKGWATGLYASPYSAHLCATTLTGGLACWGRNDQGQIGNNSKSNVSAPYVVPGIVKPKDVAVGDDHTCALGADDKIWCWGDNGNYQLGDGTTADRTVPVLATKATGFVDIEAGGNFTCGRKTDGSLWCWGYGSNGRLGNGASSNQQAPVLVTGTLGVASWRTMSDASCYIDGKAKLNCWGYNFYKNVANNSSSAINTPTLFAGVTKPVVGFGGGRYFSCAKASDSEAWCWGDNSDGQFGNGTSTFTGSATPVTVKGVKGIVGFWGGDDHNLVLTRTGEVYCSGDNLQSQCLDGKTDDLKAFTKIPYATKIVAVRGARDATCALDVDGDVWCGGEGAYGQRGDGSSSTVDAKVAVKVKAPPLIK